MRYVSLGFLLCLQAVVGKFVAYDGKADKEDPAKERNRLRHFLGLRHIDASGLHQQVVVSRQLPVVHHGLHMLNHQVKHKVGPLVSKRIMPFGRTRNHTEDTMFNSSVASNDTLHFAARAIAKVKGWDDINLMRGKTCVKMLKKHDVDFTDNKDKCIVFMAKECKVSTGTGLCKEWTDLLNFQREEAKAGAPAPVDAPQPPAGVAPDSEEILTKMDESEKMPSQGFDGELVAHDNMVTQTADWHSEYGPHAGPSYEAICAQYPDNTWCKYRGYHSKKEPPTESVDPPRDPIGTSNLVATILVSVCICLAALSCLR